MTNRHQRQTTEYESAFAVVRSAIDALTTGQADTAGNAVAVLDAALWQALRGAPEPELDRI